jgi:TonB-linked SusC/RagA family outer membrane protein
MKFYYFNFFGLSAAKFKILMIMKLTFIILLVTLLQVKASSYAQNISITEQNSSIISVLKKIRKQSGYDFFYNSSLIKNAKPVSVDFKNATISDALNIIFRNQPLSYTIEAKTVIITSAPLINFAVDVKGKVVDDKGETLPGVSVKVKGENQATSTDINGNFILKNVKDNAIIQLSFIGFESVEVSAKANLGTITLKTNSANLNEIIVVGYGTIRRGDVTGAISSLKPDAIEASQAVSVENILQGKVAGVSVNLSNASPGAASSVTIRGANSLRGDNQPLYVIDNIPQASTGEIPSSAFGGGDYQIAQNPLTNLNPSDIADIQILKDASATAIYGSRGANGVIIITTKKGIAGKTKVSANANYSVVQATNLRDMMSLSQYGIDRNLKTGVAGSQYFQEGDQTRYIFSGSVYNPNDPSSYFVLQEKNWQKEIYQTALSQNYDVTLSGGTDAIKYYLSTDVKAINGMIKGTGLNQQGLRLNLNGDISKRLKFAVSMSGNLKKNDMMSGGNSKGGATGSIARTAIDSAPFQFPAGDPLLSSNEEARTTTLAWLNDYDDFTTEKSARVSGELTWKISDDFSYNVRSGGNIRLQDRSRWFGTDLFLGLNNNGYLGLSSLNANNYTVENLVNYNHSIKNIVDISATAGVTYDDYSFVNRSTVGSNFQFKDLRTEGLHLATTINQQQPEQRDYQLLSFLGRVNLSFLKGKYLATFTGRSDGSSKFKKGNRTEFFPSAALAWRMEQEEFLKNINWLDQLKLRVGYGKTGSQSISPYNSFFNYDQVIDYANAQGDKQLAIAVANLQNSDLRWETTSAYNAGVDFSFFKGRLGGTIDAYYKETNDLLIEKALPTSTSFNSITLNQGAMSNKGLEFSLDGDIYKTKNFKWSLSGNIGINRSEIKDLGYAEAKYGNETYRAYLGNSIGDHFGVANIFIVGREPGLFWGYKTDGIIQTGDTGLPTSTIFPQTAGNIKVVDVTGDGKVDANDRTIIGNPNPDFNYGFQTAFSFKQLKLSATVYGVQGNDIVNGNVRYEQTPAVNTSNLTKNAFENRWTATNPSNLFSSSTSTIQNQVYDRYVEDGSFLRLSDITLNYTIPKTVIKKSLQNVSVFASVKNVFVITDYTGYDPEMRTFAFDGLRPGIDLNSYSNPRQFILGFNN